VRKFFVCTVAVGMVLPVGCVESGQVLGARRDNDAPADPISVSEGGAGGVGTMRAPDGNDPPEPNPATGGTPSDSGPFGVRVQVSGGDEHSCAVVDGRLYCWGAGATGGLGSGDTLNRLVPTRVGDLSEYESVGCGLGYSCAVRRGDVSCFGSGARGQLGSGQFADSNTPVSIALPAAVDQLSVGSSHSCAILSDGRLFCWGANEEGQLGQDDPFPGAGINSASPLQIGTSTNWRQVAAGQGHTCGIQDDNSLHCWGRNSGGELGLGDGAVEQIRLPQPVGTDVNWNSLDAGQNHSCAVKQDGSLYCWGTNSHGQQAAAPSGFVNVPTLIASPSSVEEVSVDTFHTCARTTEGEVQCWGRAIEGQTGSGSTPERTLAIPATPADAWTQIAAARFHTCGVRNGGILCTGANAYGALGVGDTERRQVFTPTAITP